MEHLLQIYYRFTTSLLQVYYRFTTAYQTLTLGGFGNFDFTHAGTIDPYSIKYLRGEGFGTSPEIFN